MSHSLAYFKFIRTIENEIRTYWGLYTMSEFGEKYLSQHSNKSIVEIGGNIIPYTYIDIPKQELVSLSGSFIENARENALLNFITTLEVYFNDVLNRLFYILPDLLSDNNTQWVTKDIIKGMSSVNFRNWFAKEITSKIIRNKQHDEIIKTILGYVKYDPKPLMEEIEIWRKYTYVRNCIAHNGRRVTKELTKEWPSRHTTIGGPLNITDNELMHVSKLSQRIAKYLEIPIMNMIKHEDAQLLCREIFIREGIDDVKRFKEIIYKNLSHKITIKSVQQALSYQKKTNNQPTLEFDFDSIYRYIQLNNQIE